jgi:hypothetical protein
MKQKNVYFKKKPFVLPPFLTWLFLLFFFSITTLNAQGLTNKCFKNTFGSLAIITKHNAETGDFIGNYGSTTGSVGIYTIIGKTPKYPKLNASFPVTFTIGWGTIASKPNDNSQYWSSTMSGSYDPNSKHLNLLNVISAPGPFHAVSIFNPGNLPQSQTFESVLQTDCESITNGTPIITPGNKSPEDIDYENLLKGNWTVDSKNSYGLVKNINIIDLVPRGNTYPNLRYYEVAGNLTLSTGTEIPFKGIASPHLEEQVNTFAISIVGTVNSINNDSYNIALSGISTEGGSNNIKMFLTKSSGMKSDIIPEIDDNQISTEEIFIKTK